MNGLTRLPRVRAREIQLLLLLIAGAAGTFALFTLGPIQESIRIALRLSDNQMALLQGPAIALPVVILALPFGMLVDRWSRSWVTILGGSVLVAGSLATAAASTFLTLFIARALVGAGTAAIGVAIFSLLADLYPPAQRGRAKAVMVLGQGFGKSAVFALGGILLTGFGSVPDAWRPAMLILALMLVPMVGMLFFLKEPPRSGVLANPSSATGSFRELWRFRQVILPLCGGLIAIDIALTAPLVWAAPAFHRGFGLSAGDVGKLVGLVLLISGTGGPLLGGIIADYCHRKGSSKLTMSVIGLLAIAGAPLGFFTEAGSLGIASVMFASFIILMSAAMAIGITLFTIVIPNEIRGLSLSVYIILNVIFGHALAPLLVSQTSVLLGGPEKIGVSLSFVCAITSVLAGVILIVARNSAKAVPDSPGAPTEGRDSSAAPVSARPLASQDFLEGKPL